MECKWNRVWLFADSIYELMAWVGFIFWTVVIFALLLRLLFYIFKGQ